MTKEDEDTTETFYQLYAGDGKWEDVLLSDLKPGKEYLIRKVRRSR